MKLTQATLRIQNQLQDGGNLFRLRTPIQVEIAEEDGLWHCESATLGILAVGPSQEDALRSFAEDFAVLWEEIAIAPDSNLTDDAVRLKYALQEIVESVDAAP